MNDALIDAQEAAARELAKLLPSPDLLSNIAAVRADYAARQQANDAQLSSSVTTQVEQARAGIDALSKSQATIVSLRQNFMTIERLCKECDALIENHDLIQKLSVVRNNLNTTLKDVEGMLSIAVEASDAQQSLNDPKELIRTYEQLTALEGKRRFALAAAASRPEEAGKLRDYFEKDVSRTKDIFEQTLWDYIRDYLRLAKDRVVEMQEIYDTQLREEQEEKAREARGGVEPMSPAKAPLSYKDKAYEQIQKAAQDRFFNLLNKLVKEDMKLALEEATAISNDLSDVYDYAAPCFPQRYDLFKYVVQLYTSFFVEMLQEFGKRATDIENTDILKLMGWLKQTEDQMIELGVEQSIAEFPAESGSLEPLIEEYVKRMSTSMRTWLTNMLERDRIPDYPPKPREDGRLCTPVAVDVFRLLGEQVQIVQEHSRGLMLFKAAQANLQVIADFQDLERERLKDPVTEIGLEMLCAMVNNNVRCHDLAQELATSIVDDLEPKYSNQLEFADAANGFLEVAKEAVQQTVEYIFADSGVKDLVAKLYTEEWLTEQVTESLVLTFQDYFEDIKSWIEERSFRRFAEACLEKTLVVYVNALVKMRGYINEDTIKRLARDEEQLEEFFRESITERRLKDRLEALADVRDLSSADCVESFTLSYTKLLSAHPDCPFLIRFLGLADGLGQPELVEKLLALRDGISRKEQQEVVMECKEVYETAIKAMGGNPKPGFLFSNVEALKQKSSAFPWVR